MENKISACLVVYNEEKVIRRCLESIKDVVDEIIVVHDGECEDSTLEICREYTDKIFVRPHIGVAEPHRPFSYSQAIGEWILQIDADEYLSEELRNNLKSLAQDNNIDAYEFLWPLWNGITHSSINWPYKRCFYRKKNFLYLGIPNFVAEVMGNIKKCSFTLEHQPNYNNYTWDNFKTKWLKWAKLQATFYLRNFKDIEKYNYQKEDWSLKVKLRKRFPLLLIPPEFIITFIKTLKDGAYKEFFVGYKFAFIFGIYRIIVNYFIFLEKNNLKHL